jgi:hypothetical protein
MWINALAIYPFARRNGQVRGPPVKRALRLQAMFNKAANWDMMGWRNQ